MKFVVPSTTFANVKLIKSHFIYLNTSAVEDFSNILHSLHLFGFWVTCAATNNYKTRHLSKILIHMSWCLQECITNSGASSLAYEKAINAVYISSVFLKHLIENAKSDKIEELYLSLNESESASKEIIGGKSCLLYTL